MKLLSFISLICACFILTECKSQNVKAVQIIFFDLNDFARTDTLLINGIDTVNSIKTLFSTMSDTDVKFPRRYEIIFWGKDSPQVYYGNGKYVRSNRKNLCFSFSTQCAQIAGRTGG